MKLIYRLLCLPVVNTLLVAIVKLLRPVLPASIVNFIPVTGSVKVQLPGGQSLSLLSDGRDWIATLIAWNGLDGFEPETIRIYLQLLENTGTVLDIGANTGLYALIAAAHRPSRAIYAFEPLPGAFDRLVRNVEANGLRNITPVQAAVANFDGEVALYVPDKVVVPRSASTLQGFRKAAQTLTVPALKLDTYVESNRIEQIDLLKVDTERTEHLVLQGAQNLLARDRCAIICEVLDREKENDLQAIFQEMGYAYFLISAHGLVRQERIVSDPAGKYANYLLVAEDRIPALLQGVAQHV